MSPAAVKHLVAVSLILLGFLAMPMRGASAEECDAFDKTFLVNNGSEQSFTRFGNELLLDNKNAIPCLVDILTSLKPRFAGPLVGDEDMVRFIQSTGALRTILANQGSGSIQAFRLRDNIDTITVLAYGARSNNQNARINAALILSDVIDNTNVCVIIDHLYDPSLSQSDYGKSGRLNLLGVAAVVAPWAYKENFDNLRRLQAFMALSIGKEQDIRQTKRVLDNLADRLDYQDKIPQLHKNTRLPPDIRQCYGYVPLWANQSRKQLIYED